MKKIYLLIIFGIFLISLVSAECSNLGTFKQGESINLRQVCDTCTYVTLNSVSYPDSLTTYINENMTKSGVDYNYSFSNTTKLGNYQYSVFGDKDEQLISEIICFEVSPSGNTGSNNQILFIIFFIIAYGVGFFGFFGKNALLSFIGGIYMISNGIIVYRDEFTVALSYITLGIGFIFMLVPAVETIQDNL